MSNEPKDDRLWCLHVSGMDDVHPAPDRATAQLWAAQYTAMMQERNPVPHLYDPVTNFTVQEWPWSADRHAETLARSIADNTFPTGPQIVRNRVEEGDDGPCTDCEDTGLTIQTERACSCEAGDQYRTPAAPEPDGEVVERWETGRDKPKIEQRHKDAAAWAMDRAPDSLTWDNATASHVTPDRRWQMNRVAEAMARMERAALSTPSQSGEGLAGELEAAVIDVVREQLASTDYPVSDYERQFAAAILAAIRPATIRREAMEWFGSQRNLSLSFYSPFYGDDDDQSEEWRVTKEGGSINDREWEVIGRGQTPEAAIRNAGGARGN